MTSSPQTSISTFERASLHTVVERAKAALDARIGFSLLRLGDGEGPVMCWPEVQSPGEMATVLNTWFGRAALPGNGLQVIADGLRQAIRNADVIGLPTRFQLTRSPRYAMVFDAIDRYRLCPPQAGEQLYSDSGLHWYLQWSGALAYLLRGRDSIGVIGCRDIGREIAETFGVSSVRMYLVRGEHLHPGAVTTQHWPDGFDELMAQLDHVQPGMPFLVGAGVLGKLYCDRIKARGGIALDVGSILDSWADVPSRDRYTAGSPAFGLAYLKSIPTDWTRMNAAMHKYATELHARDTTLTY